MATYLDRILEHHRNVERRGDQPLDVLVEAARRLPPTRGFRAALERDAATSLAVIAEVKRRSPSKGDLAVGLDPATVARQYEAGGATCLSVLTDADFFGGSFDDLAAARDAVALPVLRKDFTVHELDVVDARMGGADAVLLIAAALDDAELVAFHDLATEIGLDVLVEIHDEAEADRARAIGATLVGVNQRDLVTFQVDTDRAVRVAPLLGSDVVRVAESGVRGPEDAAVLRAAGYHAVLVGESLVTSGDPEAGVAALRAVG